MWSRGWKQPDELRGPGGRCRGMDERKGGGRLRRFLPSQSPIFIGNFASRWVPGSRAGSLSWVIAVIFPISFSFCFLVTTAWEQADKQGCTLSIQAAEVNKQPDRE